MSMMLAVVLSLAQAEESKKADSGLLNVFLSAGVAGACLVACGIWIKIKDASYEKRIDQMLADKDKFIASYVEMNGKYQSTMDKFAASLEVVISLVKTQQSTLDKFSTSLDVLTSLVKNQRGA